MKPRNYLDDGFEFVVANFNNRFCDLVSALPFHQSSFSDSPYDAKLHAKVPTELAREFLGLVETCLVGKVEQHVLDALPDFQVSAHKMQLGDKLDLHNDARPTALGLPDVLGWICTTSNFLGRDFQFGTKSKIETVKPHTGLICLMNSMDRNFIHGVTKLETSTEIITIVASFDGR